jgi:type III pantothenate kinase
MNLILDFGNTRIKIAVFAGNELIEKKIVSSNEALNTVLQQLSGIKNCIVGSVIGSQELIFQQLQTKYNTILFTASTPVPLKNLYQSVLTLGSDRLAAAVGAYHFYPNQNALTIDAGTCIKYNFVNQNNEYLGGAISPGIPMRLKAMHHFTHSLPAVDLDENYNNILGRNTRESLLSGAIIGAAAEVDGMIEKYNQVYSNLQVVVTGGDSDYLCKQLKNRFFANQNILLHGLNTILNFNVEK